MTTQQYQARISRAYRKMSRAIEAFSEVLRSHHVTCPAYHEAERLFSELCEGLERMQTMTGREALAYSREFGTYEIQRVLRYATQLGEPHIRERVTPVLQAIPAFSEALSLYIQKFAGC